jgi:hypothetical protein
MDGPSTAQAMIMLLLLCFVSGMLGWCFRDANGNRVRRFKVKRRQKQYTKRYKFPTMYDRKGHLY